MTTQSIPSRLAVGAVMLLLAAHAQASFTVHSGWDLLQTLPGTTFGGAPFQGVPLGSYDFGGGLQSIGLTDTIVRRQSDLTVPGPGNSGTIPIELVALHLQSVVPVDFGGGLDTYYITLQTERGGPASVGQMTINFGPEANPHGTFSSFFDVFFDVRKGSLSGPILLSDQLHLQSSGTLWSHNAPPGALLIEDVNDKLNGTDITQDFWPVGPITETHPSGAMHVVGPTLVPEPSTYFAGFLLAGLAGGSMLLQRRREKRQRPC